MSVPSGGQLISLYPDKTVTCRSILWGPSGSWLGGCDDTRATGPEGPVKQSDREIMEILEAFDATGVAHSAAPLCNADPKTVRRYAQARDHGRPVTEPVLRPKLIDPFLDKVEEWVERSGGKVRADIVHERLAAMGFGGNERTTRRAVAGARARWCRARTGRRGRRCCFARGWRGRGSGSCWRPGTGPCRR